MSKITVSAAGRVNIIGEHIDYCGGKVFPAALSLKNTVRATPNGTDKINISWTTTDAKVSLDIARLEDYKSIGLGSYQAGAAFVWQQAGHKIIGCDMVHDCTVPFGSGLSSSAAIEVSTIAALAALAGENIDSVGIALAAQKAEREYIGMNCGIMDQYASACGKAGCAMLLDCSTLDCEYVPVMLGDAKLVIANTNKPHALVTSKYNERRAETDRAFELLRPLGIKNLADLTREQLENSRDVLVDKLFDRAAHVVDECARVEAASAAMRAGDMKELGKLLNASHASLRDLYEVTGHELDSLAAAAQAHPACYGSRMTGGGFGGCTVSLVKADGVSDFKKHVAAEYEKATGYKTTFYEADISDGITVVR